MIWLTWRQHRKQFLYTLLAIAVVAAVMLPTGLSMHHTFVDSGLAACIAKVGGAPTAVTDNCDQLSQSFTSQYNSLSFVGILFVILPVFVGIFYGAPLVAREIEHGTHRFVWTQGISRTRWALGKFGIIGVAVAIIAVAYAVGVTWWFQPLVTNGGGRMGYVSFDVQGVVPIAYTLFAVALGIFIGTLSRRVLPAMGISLAAFVAVRVGIEWGARQNYLSPELAKLPIDSQAQFGQYAGDWVYRSGVDYADGKPMAGVNAIHCASNGNVSGSFTSSAVNPGDGCGSSALNGAYDWQLYQPASRFWDFQYIESGIFLALAAILVWLSLNRIRRLS